MGLHVELLKGVTETVTLFPLALPASATLALHAPNASTPLVTAEAELAELDATVTAVGTTPDVITISDAAGAAVGDEVWYQAAAGWACKARVSSLQDGVIVFESPLLGAPTIGDTVKGLRLSAELGAEFLQTRGKGYRLVWTVTLASGGTQVYQRQAAVVSAKFRAPATPDDAVRLAADMSPGWARAQTSGRWRRLAEAASDAVRGELEATSEDWPWLIGDHEAFVKPGETALRIGLAELGICPQGYDLAVYRKDYEAKLPSDVRTAIAGVIVDRNDNQAEDPGERRARGTIHIRRE